MIVSRNSGVCAELAWLLCSPMCLKTGSVQLEHPLYHAPTHAHLNARRKVVVLGAGYIGVEFAGIFRRFGAEVHVAYRGEMPLRGFDEEVGVGRLACVRRVGGWRRH